MAEHLVVGTAMLILAGCSDEPAAIQLELSATTVEIPVSMCQWGLIAADDGSWAVALDDHQSADDQFWVEVVVDTPDGDRLVGTMVRTDQLNPNFPGTGSVELRPDGDPEAQVSTAALSWDCD